ncbi:unnamed protein product [Leptidea sinapis]|uniref:Uncharacterized protein n=1 Tax=Leptidea sinapis TaxID=189913 RepID=A0A5E4QLZ7_9NEOP|nr:unnamed protein product [Leptidea sinapis]
MQRGGRTANLARGEWRVLGHKSGRLHTDTTLPQHPVPTPRASTWARARRGRSRRPVPIPEAIRHPGEPHEHGEHDREQQYHHHHRAHLIAAVLTCKRGSRALVRRLASPATRHRTLLATPPHPATPAGGLSGVRRPALRVIDTCMSTDYRRGDSKRKY